jgi:hypothetical protein
MHSLGPLNQGPIKDGGSNDPSIEPVQHARFEAPFNPTCASDYRKRGLCFLNTLRITIFSSMFNTNH